MSNSIDISIIIPVYNSEKYLAKAIQSVLNQTKREFELILIDDGSSDFSGKICDDFAAKDDRIKVVHKQNEGHCKARNDGLKLARGKYIMFLDNDDIIENNTLEDNFKLAIKYNSDIVKFGKREITCLNDEIIGEKTYQYKFEEYNREKIRLNLINLIYDEKFRNIWDGLYKSTILNEFNTEFKGVGGEDEYLNYELLEKIDNLVINDKVYYNHYFRKGYSTSSKYKEHAFYIFKKNCYKFIESCKENVSKDNVEKYNLIQINCYLKPYLAYLNKKECKKTYSQKRSEIKNIELDLRKCNLVKMFKLMKVETIIFIIYKIKLYDLLIFLPKLKH